MKDLYVSFKDGKFTFFIGSEKVNLNIETTKELIEYLKEKIDE